WFGATETISNQPGVSRRSRRHTRRRDEAHLRPGYSAKNGNSPFNFLRTAPSKPRMPLPSRSRLDGSGNRANIPERRPPRGGVGVVKECSSCGRRSAGSFHAEILSQRTRLRSFVFAALNH